MTCTKSSKLDEQINHRMNLNELSSDLLCNELEDINNQENKAIYGIYNVVAWQLGYERICLGSSNSDSCTKFNNNSNHSMQMEGELMPKHSSAGLKWEKQLLRSKSRQNLRIMDKNIKHQTTEVQKTHYFSNSTKESSMKSFQLSSMNNLRMRFQLIMYKTIKNGKEKIQYKLRDTNNNAIICSDVKIFDIKQYLQTHSMSNDNELQLTQIIQNYKQLIFASQLDQENDIKKADKINNEMQKPNHSRNNYSFESALSFSDEFHDENDSTFKCEHTTTPITKYETNSIFLSIESVIETVCLNQYENHVSQDPCFTNYLMQRKIQQNIEKCNHDSLNFYGSKENQKIIFNKLECWNSIKQAAENNSRSSIAYSTDFSSTPTDTFSEYLEINDYGYDTDLDDVLEDDSDSSMDSETLHQIIEETKKMQNIWKQKKTDEQLKKSKQKTKKLSKKSKKTMKEKPKKCRSKKTHHRRRRKKKKMPQFIQSRSHTPKHRKIRKIKINILNETIKSYECRRRRKSCSHLKILKNRISYKNNKKIKKGKAKNREAISIRTVEFDDIYNCAV